MEYVESSVKAHEWQTWRRDLKDLARVYFAEDAPGRISLIMLIGGTAGTAAHLVQTLGQALGLMHFKVQQHRSWIASLAIDQFIPGRVPAFGGAVLHKTAGRHMRRRLANIGADADAINRHASKLNTVKLLHFAEVTYSFETGRYLDLSSDRGVMKPHT